MNSAWAFTRYSARNMNKICFLSLRAISCLPQKYGKYCTNNLQSQRRRERASWSNLWCLMNVEFITHSLLEHSYYLVSQISFLSLRIRNDHSKFDTK